MRTWTPGSATRERGAGPLGKGPAPQGPDQARWAETPGALALRRFRRDRMGLAGSALILLLYLVALLAPWIAPHDPMSVDCAAVLKPPGPEHWLGTDESGRDVLSRVIWGARVSMTIALVIRLVTLAIGIAVGALAGFYEAGWM